LTEVIESLMELSRADAAPDPAFAPVDMAELASEAVSQMAAVAAQHDIELAVSSSAPNVPVSGDRVRLRRLLLLLLDNAVKFTPAGGHVGVRTRTSGDDAVIEVEDSGIGIDAEALPRIFDRFFQADASRSGRGVGLGLSIAQWIVHAHNGRIEARSNPGEGALFRVAIPLDGRGPGRAWTRETEKLSAGYRVPF
jgi:two-component system OmpR family sensor kinase